MSYNFYLDGDIIMDREKLLVMDPYMLLSVVNMKLRNEFNSLQDFCNNYEIDIEKIKSKLKSVGYEYTESINQFTAV